MKVYNWIEWCDILKKLLEDKKMRLSNISNVKSNIKCYINNLE